MKVLIIWMILHELQSPESGGERRWSSEPERFQPEWSRNDDGGGAETAESLSQWWTRIGNSDDLLRFMFKRLPEQRKRIAAAVAAADSEGLGHPWIRVPARTACSCESKNGVLDLGTGHYPRYLSTSRCKQKVCHSKLRGCKLINYTVYVLRPREGNDNATNFMLPESLWHKWYMKPITVAVACVASSDNRRN